MIRLTAAFAAGLVVASTLLMVGWAATSESESFEDPALAWHTYPDLEGYCSVKLDGQNTSLGDADAVVIEAASMRERWTGENASWSFTVKDSAYGLDYGGQVQAWAVRDEWRKHLFTGRVTNDCELVRDPLGEAPDS
jgi:hypothetical protein